MIDHIVFDLDGTLIDSAPHCIDILNEMARARGGGAVDPVLARRHLSRGGAAMIAAVLGERAGDPDAAIAEFRSHYVNRATPPQSLFGGVADGLTALHAAGLRLASCSNKPQHLCEKIVADLRLERFFAVIVGSQPGLRRKPDPQSLMHTLELLDTTPERALYVGDSEIDAQTADAADVAFHFVRYGYADDGYSPTGAACHDSFFDLTRAILAQVQPEADLVGVAGR